MNCVINGTKDKFKTIGILKCKTQKKEEKLNEKKNYKS